MQGSWESSAPILIVDDSKEDLLLLQRVLLQCKIVNPVVPCISGDEYLEELERALGRNESPVLVLLDLKMAPMSGIDVLEAMNRQGCIKTIPVVMLSSIRDIQSVHAGYQLGAQTFMIKPVRPEDIMQVVSSVSRISVGEISTGYVLYRTTDSFEARPGDTSILRKRGTAFPA